MADTPGNTPPDTPEAVLARARLIVPAVEIQSALDRLAGEITTRLARSRPIAMVVMHGGLVFAGQLLTRLPFALDTDYVHVSRYGSGTSGGQLRWIAGPHLELAGRTILLLDDILDEGVTLSILRERLLGLGAHEVLIAALAVKKLPKPAAIAPDFVGVYVPNEFVIGFGMDVAGAWRNLPAIYAL